MIELLQGVRPHRKPAQSFMDRAGQYLGRAHAEDNTLCPFPQGERTLITDKKQRVSAQPTGLGRTDDNSQSGDRWQRIGDLANAYGLRVEEMRK
ncbi:MAG: hypothetical protein AAGJ74_06055 [Pseudomonadota bacterium]